MGPLPHRTMPLPDFTSLMPDASTVARRLQTVLLPALNHLLATDAQAQEKLRSHHGKSLVLSALGVDLAWTVGDQGLLQAADQPVDAQQADLHIALAADALRDAIARRTPLRLSAAQVRGDAELAQTVSWLMAHVRWDAEDDLARLIGDIPAHRVARGGQAVLTQGKQRWERAQTQARDWFAASPRALVSRCELATLQDAVRELRDSAARLDKRLDLLRRRLDDNAA